jgi:hypothetical protein
MSAKMGGLSAVADALNRGDVFRAQLGTLALRLPDPPPATFTSTNFPKLTSMLDTTGMLRGGRGSARPTTNESGQGDLAASNDTAGSEGHAKDPDVIPAQEFVPFPEIWEMPWARPWTRPMPPTAPWDLARPGPVRPDMPWSAPNYYERREGAPTSPGEPDPYDSEDCKEQRADADRFCRDLEEEGLLGKDKRRNLGRTFDECWRGRVSARCAKRRGTPWI